ncbi:MAG: hypothetical protein ABI747_00100 [Candidatus Moraniibacteriota bacterium]
MNENIILIVLIALTLAAYFFSLVYVVGIVWRVEMELDISYKFFSATVVFLVLSEILDLLPSVHASLWGGELLHATRFLSAITLFFGMYFMRDLIRKMDGEKQAMKK